jgi:hypothetical protein
MLTYGMSLLSMLTWNCFTFHANVWNFINFWPIRYLFYTLAFVSQVTIFRHIKSNNSGTAKVKMVKNERDPPLCTSKQLIKV